jgi:hypothetical protein
MRLLAHRGCDGCERGYCDRRIRRADSVGSGAIDLNQDYHERARALLEATITLA